MNKKTFTEADIRTKFITPALAGADGNKWNVMTQLREEVVANCDHLKNLKFSHALPYAFTEHGAVMLASVLNSPTAIEVSIQVVRTFNRLREYVANHKALASKLALLENKYDGQFKIVFDALRELMKSPLKPRRRIGFEVKKT